LRSGGQARVGAVAIYAVSAAHSNGLDPAFLNPDQAQALESNGLTAYVGPAGGFVLRFSNGLVAYLSGDTGVMADQDLVVRQHFKANLMVLNIGDTFTTGPAEAAYVANVLVQPRSVIASHANEQATQDGLVRAGTKTQAFVQDTRAAVLVPLSGRTMAFDGTAACASGCNATTAPGH
jgi:L-ascorbate metabolism protein UlaG (beta-lactamase superfamily)